jgi:hypothetical protein
MKLAVMISSLLIIGNSWALLFERPPLALISSSKKVSLRGQTSLSSFKCPMDVSGNIVPGCSIFSQCLYNHPLRLVNSEGNTAVPSCPSAPTSSCTGTEVVVADTASLGLQFSPTTFVIRFGNWDLVCIDPNDTTPLFSGGVIGDSSYENGGFFEGDNTMGGIFAVPYYSVFCQSLLHLIKEGIVEFPN